MNNQDSIILIPARYGSSRFPGKPLAMLAGKSMLNHVIDAAKLAAKHIPNTEVLVATDDQRILEHAKYLKTEAVMTPKECESGSDRAIAALDKQGINPDYLINLQGDVPLIPPKIIADLLINLKNSNAEVLTPVAQLSWPALDTMRTSKSTNPFSGTTVIINQQQQAIWFSKNITPAIRDEDTLRQQLKLSPIYQHIGIYGYTTNMLRTFASLPPSNYEQLEGLEQLRFLENGYSVQTICYQSDEILDKWRGVDTKQDAEYVEKIMLNDKINRVIS